MERVRESKCKERKSKGVQAREKKRDREKKSVTRQREEKRMGWLR